LFYILVLHVSSSLGTKKPQKTKNLQISGIPEIIFIFLCPQSRVTWSFPLSALVERCQKPFVYSCSLKLMLNHRMKPLYKFIAFCQQNKMIFSSREGVNNSNLKCQDNVALKPNKTCLRGKKDNRRKPGPNLIRDIDCMGQF